MHSRPIHELDCRTQSFLIAICLSDADLVRLGTSVAELDRCELAPAMRQRNILHSACRTNTALAQRMNDVLDLRYVDLLWAVRASDEDAVRDLVQHSLEDDRRGDYPALLWVLNTDVRARVQSFGQQVLVASFIAGCRSIREASETGKALS